MFLGAIFLAIGLLLLTSQLLGLDYDTLFALYWPSIIILYGIFRLVVQRRLSPTTLCILFAGLLFQFRTLGWLSENIWTILLAIVLIFLGMKFVIDAFEAKRHARAAQNGDGTQDHFGHKGASASSNRDDGFRSTTFEDRDFLDDRFLFSSEKRIYRSRAFSGGRVDVDFSAIFLDLRNVWPMEKEMTLDVSLRFGTLTIDVPADWHVIVDGRHCYTNQEAANAQPTTCTLIVTSRVFAGTLRIL
ncbi:MAG: hypothetical protein SOR89_04445 [Ndongobacter sp.]|nr:hypothetical protein [Ndongobacter sp.]